MTRRGRLPNEPPPVMSPLCAATDEARARSDRALGLTVLRRVTPRAFRHLELPCRDHIFGLNPTWTLAMMISALHDHSWQTIMINERLDCLLWVCRFPTVASLPNFAVALVSAATGTLARSRAQRAPSVIQRVGDDGRDSACIICIHFAHNLHVFGI